MLRFLLPDARYHKAFRVLAVLWTVLIFVLCLLPGHDFPEVNVKFIDKWTHLILFGVFTFLWLGASLVRNTRKYILLFVFAVVTGSLIELLQGAFPSLGRSMELGDAIADAIGGLLGLAMFYILSRRASAHYRQ
ncbi:MAG: VanZ family protein [Taibaiella sp.]|nr:VanZ family protein [Taibaiella sp.]